MAIPARSLAVSAAILMAGALAACGGDESTASASDRPAEAAAIADIDGWCDAVAKTDRIFTITEHSGGDFASKQPRYVEAAALIDQLADGVDLVDDSHRESVTMAVDRIGELVHVMATAPDEATAEAEMAPLWERTDDAAQLDEATAWIDDTCDVSID